MHSDCLIQYNKRLLTQRQAFTQKNIRTSPPWDLAHINAIYLNLVIHNKYPSWKTLEYLNKICRLKITISIFKKYYFCFTMVKGGINLSLVAFSLFLPQQFQEDRYISKLEVYLPDSNSCQFLPMFNPSELLMTFQRIYLYK